MTTTTCTCGKPTAGAVLCPDCTKTLAYAIANVAGHYEDLGTVAMRQTRYGGTPSKGSIGKTQPLPVDMRFVSGPPEAAHHGAAMAPLSQLRWDAWNTVVAWTRTVMEEQEQVLGPVCPRTAACLHTSCAVLRLRRWPGNTIRSMCLYLDRQHRWIEGRDWATAMLDELLDLERRLVRAVNRPPDRWYAGKCDCGVELYAEAERTTVTCRACEGSYDVATRREFLLGEAKDYLVTATEAAGALLAWTDYDGSETKLVDRIRKWRDRDRVLVRGQVELGGRERDLYRLGDLQELLVEHAQREQQRRIGA